MSHIAFAAVPWVRTDQPLQLGPWMLWPNTKEDWETQTGVDFTDFMSMYRTRRNTPVGNAGSILTRADKGDFTRQDAHQAIFAYSTVAWLGHEWRADAWVFEFWRLPPTADSSMNFIRTGKFTSNFTRPDRDPVYPGPYVFPIRIRTDIPKQILNHISAELTKSDSESTIRTLGQFHEVRFETPYFSTAGNDLETLWSGFESMYLRESARDTKKKQTILQRLLGLFLRKHIPRRAERLSLAIQSDLSSVPDIHQDVLAGIAQWADVLWLSRNQHSHAGHVEPASVIEPLNSTALSVGLRLAEALISIRIWRSAGDSEYMLSSATQRLNEIFLRVSTINWVVSNLKSSKREDLYPPRGMPFSTERLSALGSRLKDFNSFENVEGWLDVRDVAKARGVMRRVITAWLKDLLASPPPNVDLSSLSDFPSKDRELLAELKKQGLAGSSLEDELDEALVDYIIQSEAWHVGGYGIDSPTLDLGGVIPMRHWLRAYIRLQELYIGHELV
ncbi:hypothetical protein HPP06_37825 [Corallococcus exiguus]|nr:hypothetical protein [Corallococcus exiguus]